MKSPTHAKIANSYALWMKYVDPSGLDSEEAFNAMSVEEKIDTIKACFGEEQTDTTTATITSIENNQGIKTVNLEWHGIDDHTVEDFDLDQLGERCKGIGRSTGGNLTSGWVVLEGDCKLNEGDTINLLPREEEAE